MSVATAGETIENPVNGERLTFLATSRDTDGELVRIEHTFAPGGFVPAAHVHPGQEECFQILSGSPRFRVGDNERTARAGDVLTVPAGIPHTWWNAGDADTRVVIEFRPALRTEELFETLYALGRDGRLNKRGIPNPLLAAVLAKRFENEAWIAPTKEVLLSRLPPSLIRLLIAVLAPVGRLLGYGAVGRASPRRPIRVPRP